MSKEKPFWQKNLEEILNQDEKGDNGIGIYLAAANLNSAQFGEWLTQQNEEGISWKEALFNKYPKEIESYENIKPHFEQEIEQRRNSLDASPRNSLGDVQDQAAIQPRMKPRIVSAASPIPTKKETEQVTTKNDPSTASSSFKPEIPVVYPEKPVAENKGVSAPADQGQKTPATLTTNSLTGNPDQPQQVLAHKGRLGVSFNDKSKSIPGVAPKIPELNIDTVRDSVAEVTNQVSPPSTPAPGTPTTPTVLSFRPGLSSTPQRTSNSALTPPPGIPEIVPELTQQVSKASSSTLPEEARVAPIDKADNKKADEPKQGDISEEDKTLLPQAIKKLVAAINSPVKDAGQVLYEMASDIGMHKFPDHKTLSVKTIVKALETNELNLKGESNDLDIYKTIITKYSGKSFGNSYQDTYKKWIYQAAEKGLAAKLLNKSIVSPDFLITEYQTAIQNNNFKWLNVLASKDPNISTYTPEQKKDLFFRSIIEEPGKGDLNRKFANLVRSGIYSEQDLKDINQALKDNNLDYFKAGPDAGTRFQDANPAFQKLRENKGVQKILSEAIGGDAASIEEAPKAPKPKKPKADIKELFVSNSKKVEKALKEGTVEVLWDEAVRKNDGRLFKTLVRNEKAIEGLGANKALAYVHSPQLGTKQKTSLLSSGLLTVQQVFNAPVSYEVKEEAYEKLTHPSQIEKLAERGDDLGVGKCLRRMSDKQRVELVQGMQNDPSKDQITKMVLLNSTQNQRADIYERLDKGQLENLLSNATQVGVDLSKDVELLRKAQVQNLESAVRDGDKDRFKKVKNDFSLDFEVTRAHPLYEQAVKAGITQEKSLDAGQQQVAKLASAIKSITKSSSSVIENDKKGTSITSESKSSIAETLRDGKASFAEYSTILQGYQKRKTGPKAEIYNAAKEGLENVMKNYQGDTSVFFLQAMKERNLKVFNILCESQDAKNKLSYSGKQEICRAMNSDESLIEPFIRNGALRFNEIYDLSDSPSQEITNLKKQTFASQMAESLKNSEFDARNAGILSTMSKSMLAEVYKQADPEHLDRMKSSYYAPAADKEAKELLASPTKADKQKEASVSKAVDRETLYEPTFEEQDAASRKENFAKFKTALNSRYTSSVSLMKKEPNVLNDVINTLANANPAEITSVDYETILSKYKPSLKTENKKETQANKKDQVKAAIYRLAEKSVKEWATQEGQDVDSVYKEAKKNQPEMFSILMTHAEGKNKLSKETAKDIMKDMNNKQLQIFAADGVNSETLFEQYHATPKFANKNKRAILLRSAITKAADEINKGDITVVDRLKKESPRKLAAIYNLVADDKMREIIQEKGVTDPKSAHYKAVRKDYEAKLPKGHNGISAQESPQAFVTKNINRFGPALWNLALDTGDSKVYNALCTNNEAVKLLSDNALKAQLESKIINKDIKLFPEAKKTARLHALYKTGAYTVEELEGKNGEVVGKATKKAIESLKKSKRLEDNLTRSVEDPKAIKGSLDNAKESERLQVFRRAIGRKDAVAIERFLEHASDKQLKGVYNKLTPQDVKDLSAVVLSYDGASKHQELLQGEMKALSNKATSKAYNVGRKEIEAMRKMEVVASCINDKAFVEGITAHVNKWTNNKYNDVISAKTWGEYFTEVQDKAKDKFKGAVSSASEAMSKMRDIPQALVRRNKGAGIDASENKLGQAEGIDLNDMKAVASLSRLAESGHDSESFKKALGDRASYSDKALEHYYYTFEDGQVPNIVSQAVWIRKGMVDDYQGDKISGGDKDFVKEMIKNFPDKMEHIEKLVEPTVWQEIQQEITAEQAKDSKRESGLSSVSDIDLGTASSSNRSSTGSKFDVVPPPEVKTASIRDSEGTLAEPSEDGNKSTVYSEPTSKEREQNPEFLGDGANPNATLSAPKESTELKKEDLLSSDSRPPSQLFDEQGQATPPPAVQKSTFPQKVANYFRDAFKKDKPEGKAAEKPQRTPMGQRLKPIWAALENAGVSTVAAVRGVSNLVNFGNLKEGLKQYQKGSKEIDAMVKSAVKRGGVEGVKDLDNILKVHEMDTEKKETVEHVQEVEKYIGSNARELLARSLKNPDMKMFEKLVDMNIVGDLDSSGKIIKSEDIREAIKDSLGYEVSTVPIFNPMTRMQARKEIGMKDGRDFNLPSRTVNRLRKLDELEKFANSGRFNAKDQDELLGNIAKKRMEIVVNKGLVNFKDPKEVADLQDKFKDNSHMLDAIDKTVGRKDVPKRQSSAADSGVIILNERSSVVSLEETRKQEGNDVVTPKTTTVSTAASSTHEVDLHEWVKQAGMYVNGTNDTGKYYLDKVGELVKSNPDAALRLMNSKGQDGKTPLDNARDYGGEELFKELHKFAQDIPDTEVRSNLTKMFSEAMGKRNSVVDSLPAVADGKAETVPVQQVENEGGINEHSKSEVVPRPRSPATRNIGQNVQISNDGLADDGSTLSNLFNEAPSDSSPNLAASAVKEDSPALTAPLVTQPKHESLNFGDLPGIIKGMETPSGAKQTAAQSELDRIFDSMVDDLQEISGVKGSSEVNNPLHSSVVDSNKADDTAPALNSARKSVVSVQQQSAVSNEDIIDMYRSRDNGVSVRTSMEDMQIFGANDSEIPISKEMTPAEREEFLNNLTDDIRKAKGKERLEVLHESLKVFESAGVKDVTKLPFFQELLLNPKEISYQELKQFLKDTEHTKPEWFVRTEGIMENGGINRGEQNFWSKLRSHRSNMQREDKELYARAFMGGSKLMNQDKTLEVFQRELDRKQPTVDEGKVKDINYYADILPRSLKGQIISGHEELKDRSLIGGNKKKKYPNVSSERSELNKSLKKLKAMDDALARMDPNEKNSKIQEMRQEISDRRVGMLVDCGALQLDKNKNPLMHALDKNDERTAISLVRKANPEHLTIVLEALPFIMSSNKELRGKLDAEWMKKEGVTSLLEEVNARERVRESSDHPEVKNGSGTPTLLYTGAPSAQSAEEVLVNSVQPIKLEHDSEVLIPASSGLPEAHILQHDAVDQEVVHSASSKTPRQQAQTVQSIPPVSQASQVVNSSTTKDLVAASVTTVPKSFKKSAVNYMENPAANQKIEGLVEAKVERVDSGAYVVKGEGNETLVNVPLAKDEDPWKKTYGASDMQFEPGFTGVLKVYRTENGNPSEQHYDEIIVENGKAIGIVEAKEGESLLKKEYRELLGKQKDNTLARANGKFDDLHEQLQEGLGKKGNFDKFHKTLSDIMENDEGMKPEDVKHYNKKLYDYYNKMTHASGTELAQHMSGKHTIGVDELKGEINENKDVQTRIETIAEVKGQAALADINAMKKDAKAHEIEEKAAEIEAMKPFMKEGEHQGLLNGLREAIAQLLKLNPDLQKGFKEGGICAKLSGEAKMEQKVHKAHPEIKTSFERALLEKVNSLQPDIKKFADYCKQVLDSGSKEAIEAIDKAMSKKDSPLIKNYREVLDHYIKQNPDKFSSLKEQHALDVMKKDMQTVQKQGEIEGKDAADRINKVMRNNHDPAYVDAFKSFRDGLDKDTKKQFEATAKALDEHTKSHSAKMPNASAPTIGGKVQQTSKGSWEI